MDTFDKVMHHICAFICLVGVFVCSEWVWPFACLMWVSNGYDSLVEIDKLKALLDKEA